MTELFESPAPSRRDARRAQESTRIRKAKRRRGVLAIVFGIAIIGAALALAWPQISGIFTSEPAPEDYPGPGTGEVVVEIPSGATGADIGRLLEDAGVVRTAEAFSAAFTSNPNSGNIQAGAFVLMLEMKASDAVAALLDPANRAEITITVPEGFIATQVYERIARVMGFAVEDVQAAAADTAAIGLPAEAGGSPEGWFAPATYPFAPSATATDILATMVAQTVTNLQAAGVPQERWQEVLIKASIVEREATPEYYGQVARVIENRLTNTAADVGGRLQMDSTVLYGVGQIGGVPTQAQLDTDTPYNTYLNPGLPPTPIGSPGRAAIEAVRNPPEGDWLYFVTVNLDTGETKFASTLEEHLRYVQEFREWRDANGG